MPAALRVCLPLLGVIRCVAHFLLPARCRVFDVQKHYWGATIIARGFRALYMVGRAQLGWVGCRL